jgi:hypothetical protein
MTETSPGQFQVNLNENISITVAATFDPFAATFAVDGAPINGPAPNPANDLEQSVSFSCPGTAGHTVTATLVFDFIPDSTGAYPPGSNYSIVIAGANGTTDNDQIVPPPISSRTVFFNT